MSLGFRFGGNTHLALVLALALAGLAHAQTTVDEVMDGLLTRLYATHSLEELYALDDAAVQKLITPEERRVLATKHWYFDVNVPVTVSILRNVEQKVIPFWIPESGFEMTDLTARNKEGWQYEVWQKEFPAGRVELGINGFDNFRPHYLVCVGPKNQGDTLELSNAYPANQTLEEMKEGALTYHDWTELVLTEIPESLRGQTLLPTIRGRGREAGLVGAFRKTPYPSSKQPEPVFLTWSEDPKTTQNIQWRTSTDVSDGVALYRKKGSEDSFLEASASPFKMEDRMLANDRYCNWFTAVLRDLEPGTAYEYKVGSKSIDAWSDSLEFITAPATPKPFSFLYCSDTHCNEQWGELLTNTFYRHPDAAFCVISGDLIGTGLEREDWDMFFTYGQPMYARRPVMPSIGNHDAQLGLGAGMYIDLFGLPKNGPKNLDPEHAYTFTYENTQFFMLDVMSDRMPQRDWLDEELAKSTATWKIAVFHFPFYTTEAEYPYLHEAWGTLFDKYHVDLVFTGHVHTYLRTAPMYNGKEVATPAEGTVYIQSVSIPSRNVWRPKPDFVEAWVGGGLFCNYIQVDGNRLHFQALGPEGVARDELVIEK